MTRTRGAVFFTLVLVFMIVGGVLIYANQNRGGGQPVTFNVTVSGAKSMNPSELTAHQGNRITINVTSDQDGEVHLHIYDIPFETKAGETVSHTFTADKTCSCDIEWEETSTHLGTLTVSP